MDTFEQIKKFLNEGEKCLLIENGKPVGVVLTMEEYEKLRRSEEKEAQPVSGTDNRLNPNPIGEAMAKEMIADDITLEDLGIDELPY